MSSREVYDLVLKTFPTADPADVERFAEGAVWDGAMSPATVLECWSTQGPWTGDPDVQTDATVCEIISRAFPETEPWNLDRFAKNEGMEWTPDMSDQEIRDAWGVSPCNPQSDNYDDDPES